MVKEGLEGALMEGIGTETVVWQWHVFCTHMNPQLLKIFTPFHIEVHSLLKVDYLIIAEELQLVDLKAVALK